jgi:hypothetical protein
MPIACDIAYHGAGQYAHDSPCPPLSREGVGHDPFARKRLLAMVFEMSDCLNRAVERAP